MALYTQHHLAFNAHAVVRHNVAQDCNSMTPTYIGGHV